MPNYTLTNDTLTLSAMGQDILVNTNTVQFNGLARQVTGNFDHVAFVSSQQNTNALAQAGVCVFEQPIVNGIVASTTKFGCLVVNPNGQLVLLSRTNTATQVTQLGITNKAIPLWLRLKRTGNDLIAYYSQKPLVFVGGDYQWQLLCQCTDFFINWTQVMAGMMGNSHDTAPSTVVFKGLDFNIGTPYVLDFDITSIRWTRQFSGLSAVILDTNPSNKSLEYSKDGQNWTTNSLFQNLTGGNTYTFSARDVNQTNAIKTKTDTAPNSTTNSIIITSLTVAPGTSNLYNVTVNVTNPDVYILEYRMDTGAWKNNGIFTDIVAGSHTFEVRNRDNTAFVSSKTQSIGTASVNTNEIADIQITIPAMLNQVDLAFLGEFDIPLHPNPRFANQRILEIMISGPLWKQQSTAGNIFKKGVTSVDYRMLTPTTEYQEAPYNFSFRSPIDIRNISFIDYCQHYDRLNLGTEDDAAAMNAVDYSFYSDITNNIKYNVPQIFNGNPPPEFRGRIVMTDIENGSINLLNTDIQSYVNRMIAITQAYLDAVGPNTLVTHMYQSLPKQNVGFGITKAMYNESVDSSWQLAANGAGLNFPTNLIGKSFGNIDNRFASMFEYYPPYETFLDEGVQLYNVNNEPLKDYNGNTLPLFSHFGTIQLNRAQANFKHTQLHWAAHCAAGLGINRRLLPKERSLILQVNNWNLLYYYNNYAGQPPHATIKQINDGNERYPMPDYMVQGMMCIAFFSNTIYEHWDSPISIGTPTDRSQGEARPDWPAPARIDYRTVAAQQAMAKRIALGSVVINGTQHTLAEMIDGTEIYLLERITVNYLTVPNFTTDKQIYPTDWMEHQLSPVMAIVNTTKRLIAIWGTIAYAGSNEPTEVEVVYNENGLIFRQKITLQVRKNSLFIFPL